MSERILIVDDEANMRWVLKEALRTSGYEVEVAAGGQEALQEMSRCPADLILLDLKLKGMDGLATLRRLLERWPEVVVIILTAYGTVATAVEAMQLGAADYLRKPFDVEEIVFKLQRALERKALQAEIRRLRAYGLPSMNEVPAGSHVSWQRCIEQARSLTALDLDIVFAGESGSGRTTMARFVHGLSEHRDAPLVELDFATLVGELQPQLLGGTGGTESAWSRAGAGTLLLRNAHLLAAEALVALAGLVKRRGNGGPRLLLTAEAVLRVDAPLFPARVQVPPLRERIADLPLLAQAFVPNIELTPPALHALEQYGWPGNVAELRGVLLRATAIAGGGQIEIAHLPPEVRLAPAPDESIRLPDEGISMEAVEIALLRQAMERAHGNKTRAAELLGLTRHTLLYRLEKYGLETA